MKILLVHIFFSTAKASGANIIVYSLMDMLQKAGNEVFIFASDEQPYVNPDYEYTKFFPKSHLDDRKKSVWGYLKHYINSIYNIKAAVNIGQLLDEIKPDIVHIHSTWELSNSIVHQIRKRNIPIIYTVHDISKWCPAVFQAGLNYCHDCKGFNTIPCIMKKCIYNNLPYSIYYAVRAFFDRILYRDKDIVWYLPVSEAVKDFMIQSGVDENKIIVVNNFLDDNYNSDNTICEKQEYFLYAGGPSKQKGFDTLIDAINMLPENIPLHLAGMGDFETYPKQINFDKHPNIKILGQLSPEQLKQEYKNCISAIMPSECFETFGMINLEAASYGKPSIASNIGGLGTVVDNNATGLLFEPGCPQELADCILKYWNDKNLAFVHGQNAHKKLLEKYTPEIYLEKILDVYNKVLENKSGK